MPPTTVKKTKIVFGGDVDPLEKEMKRGETAVENFGEKASGTFKKMAAGIVASLACCQIVDFFKDSMMVAIEAEETFSKFGTVFENVFQQAEVSAQNLTENYGLSEKAAKGLLSATGDLLVGLGAQENVALKLSEKVQQLSVDLSSFQNLQGGAARASDIITKAMLGERDALTSLGIKILESDVQHELLRRGQENLTGQALLLAKANITLDSVVAQSGKAIGDYARTADSAANQLRLLGNTFEDFQVKIGQNLIQNEKFQESFKVINDILSDPAFIKAISDIGSMILSALGSILPLVGGIIKGLVEISSTAIQIVSDIMDTIDDIPVLMELVEVYRSVAGVISGELAEAEERQIAAIQEQNSQFIDLTTTLRKVRDEAGFTAEVMKEVSEEMSKIEDPARRTMAAINALKFEKLVEDMKLTDEEIQNIIKDFDNIEDPAKRYQKILTEISRGKYDTDTKNLSSALKELTKEYAISEEKINDVKVESDDLTKSTEKLNEITKEQRKEIQKQKEAYDKLSSSLGILAGKQLKEVNREAQDLNRIFQENKDVFSDNSDQAKIFDEKLQKLIDQFGGLNQSPQIVQDLIREFRQLNEIPEFPEQDNFEEFAAIADEMNTDILPEATLKFQETEDKIEDLNEELEKESPKLYSESILNLTDSIVKIGSSAIDAAEKMGIIGEKTAESFSKALDVVGSAGKTVASIYSGDVVGAITGAIDTLGGLFDLLSGASGEFEAAQRRLQGLSGVSEDWAEKIEQLAQELGGAESAERAFNAVLADIIKSTDITIDNFDDFIRKTREIVSVFERGNASAQETAKNFGAAFTEMLKAAEDLGQMGGEDITGLIMLADEFGLSVKEIAEFVETKEIAAFDNWKKAVEVFGDASIPIFDEMKRKEEILAKIPDEIEAGIEGLSNSLINLTDAHRANSEEMIGTMDVFEEKTLAAIAALEQQGITGEDAIVPLQDLLNRLAFLQSEYGLELDDTIQKLIDEGKTSGMITGDIMSDSEKQIALQERQVEVLELIAEKFGVITRSVEDMGVAAEGITDGMNVNFRDTSRNLSGIADTIYDEVIPAINQMGNENDDVMWQHSILPDLRDWENMIDIIGTNIKKNIITSIHEMGKNYDKVQKEINDNPILEDIDLENVKSSFFEIFDQITGKAQAGSSVLSDIFDYEMETGEMIDRLIQNGKKIGIEGHGSLDLANDFLYEPVLPENEVNSDIYNNFFPKPGDNGQIGFDGGTDSNRNITANINLNMYVTDNSIDTIQLAEKIKTVFKDNVQGTVDVVIEEIDQV